MTTKWEKATLFDVTTDKLVEVLTHPDFQMAQRKNDSAVVTARFNEVSRTDDKLIFEIQATEYERGMTGLNKKKTVQSVTRNEWDLKKKSVAWTYSSPSTDKVSITGFSRVEEAGGKAKMVGGFAIDVKIPFLGKKIEQAITKGMTEGRDRYDATVREFCQKLG